MADKTKRRGVLKKPADKPPGDKVVVLSRGQRKRQKSKSRVERKKDLVAFVTKALEQEKVIKKHGALGDMSAIESALQEAEVKTFEDQLKQTAKQLFPETHMSDARRQEQEIAAVGRYQEIWDACPAFHAAPVNYVIGLAKVELEERNLKRTQYREMKSQSRREGSVSSKVTQTVRYTRSKSRGDSTSRASTKVTVKTKVRRK